MEEKKASTISDPLNSYLKFYKPDIFISEFIPFGPNQFDVFVDALGSEGAANKTTFLTEYMDRTPEETTFETPSRLAKVNIKNLSEEAAMFTLEVLYPEEAGIEQIEHFGTRVNLNGQVTYGLKLEEVGTSSDFHSSDFLCRVLSDLYEDSSKAMHSLLSTYQRRILNIIYPNAELVGAERIKNFVLLTDKTKPELTQDLLQKPRYQDEIEQLIGPIQSHDFSDTCKIVHGQQASIIVTSEQSKGEWCLRKLTRYLLKVRGLKHFISNYFDRMWTFWDEAAVAKEKIAKVAEPTTETDKAELRNDLLDLNRNVIMLADLNDTIDAALTSCKTEIQEVKGECDFPISCDQLLNQVDKLQKRIKKGRNISQALAEECNGMIDILGSLAEKELREMTKAQERLTEQRIRGNEQMEILQVLFTLTATLEGVGILAGYILQGEPFIGIFILLISIIPAGIALYLIKKAETEFSSKKQKPN